MFLYVAALCAVGVVSSIAQAGAPLPVTVYYESLCPDSIKFYTTQLYPIMEVANLSTNVDLTLVPYGKSSHERAENGSWIFKCHHGERECYGNKVHACAIKHMTSKNERLTYINCLLKTMMNNRDAVFPTEECAKQISHEDKSMIIQCANTTLGDDELAAMGNKTIMLQPKLTSVPTIVFNNVYNQNDQAQAQTSFKSVLCKYLPSPQPAECEGTSAASAASISAALFSTVMALLLTRYIQ